MAIIKKQINDTNASFRNINAGDAKNTDLFLDQNQRAFFGEKENIDVRLHKNNLAQAILFIASVLPRKYDCSSVHKKIFYSSEFVIDSLRKLDGFFGDADEKIVTWHIRQAVEQKNGKIDDRFYLNNLIQQFSYIDANGKSCESKFTIRDYLAGGYSSIEFHSKENGSVYDFYVTNSTEYQENYGAEQDKENDDIEKSESRNRILFGAPGTGKSFQLNNDAEFSFAKIRYTKDERIELFKQSKFIDVAKNYHTFIGNNILNEYSFDTYAEDSLSNLNEKLKELESLKKASKDDASKYHDLTNRCSALKAYIRFAETILCDTVERVTFHPNYSYAQFVGTYKPVSSCTNLNIDDDIQDSMAILQNSSKTAQEKYDLLYEKFKNDDMLTRLPILLGLYTDDSFNTKKQDGSAASGNNSVERNHGLAIRPYITLGLNEGISYKYVPGPFMRTLVKALNNPKQAYLLIIEEINRANVAAVFGDVFQLLDRKNGVSEYPIAASEDIKRYLRENSIQNCDELKIPSNMYIWATMNSADQGVFPMDTAFKRRWEFEYIGVNDKEDKIKDFEIPMQEKKDGDGNPVKDAEGNVTHEWMKWNELRTQINDKLTACGKNEDKLLGPFFISMEKLESVNGHNEKEAANFVKSFKSKVLMYLFEDVCKMRPGDLFNCEKMRYSEICKKFDSDGIGVFNF